MAESMNANAYCKLFVVDDDDLVSCSVQALLEAELECRVTCFSDPQACLKQVRIAPPDCIISDYQMPIIDGLEFQRQTSEMNDKIPFVFMSGKASLGIAVQAMEFGAVAFVEKPISPNQLIEKVKVALELSKRIRETSIEKEEARERLTSITSKEWEVLNLLLEGRLIKQIASELNIGRRTVERHKQLVLQKSDCESLVEVAILVQLAAVQQMPTNFIAPSQRVPKPLSSKSKTTKVN